jgi:hypothetical protein
MPADCWKQHDVMRDLTHITDKDTRDFLSGRTLNGSLCQPDRVAAPRLSS